MNRLLFVVGLTLSLGAALACRSDSSSSPADTGDAATDASDIAEDTSEADLDATNEPDADTSTDDATLDRARLDTADTALEPEPDVTDAGVGDTTDDGLDSDPDAADTADDASDTADVTDGNADADTADTTDVTDTDSADPVDTAVDCDELILDINAERDALEDCERSSQCAIRSNPLCPFNGCYTPFRAGESTEALTALEDLYLDADCIGGGICACAPLPPVLFCDDGRCGTCPLDCPYECALDCECVEDGCGCDLPLCAEASPASCDPLADAIVEAADDLSGCRVDSDCEVLATTVCPTLPCHVGVNRFGRSAHLDALMSAFEAAGCLGPACLCGAAPDFECLAGRCQPVD